MSGEPHPTWSLQDFAWNAQQLVRGLLDVAVAFRWELKRCDVWTSDTMLPQSAVPTPDGAAGASPDAVLLPVAAADDRVPFKAGHGLRLPRCGHSLQNAPSTGR